MNYFKSLLDKLRIAASQSQKQGCLLLQIKTFSDI